MFSKLIRLGNDAELRYTTNNKAVLVINGAYDVGWGDKKKTQWIECAVWGKQAEALGKLNLSKGSQVVIHADDLEVETWESNGKNGTKLKCRAINVELVGKSEKPKQQAAKTAEFNPGDGGFNDNFDDDIPF
jgi:single-strand DNA-binding protein